MFYFAKKDFLLKAIIDLGTNTFHLYIAEVKANTLHEYYKMQIPVKLGKGGINNGEITSDAFRRGLTALHEFAKYIERFQVKDIQAFATSAIRNASNGSQFIEEAHRQFGIPIQAISGDVEAGFIYRGVNHSFKFPDETVLVMDIGGGSVELIIGKQQNILWKQSFEIGAARLIDLFHHENPISSSEVEALTAYLTEKLKPAVEACEKYNPQIFIGAAGSFETLLDVVINDLAVIPLSLSKHAYEIRREDFDVFVEIMKTGTQAQREKLKGMVSFRVEMITVAALLMQFAVEQFQIKRIICSDYSLKEGVLFS